MKKLRFFTLLLAACLCLGGVFACAEPWSEEYYRAHDVTDELSDEERDSLDEDCLDFMKTYHLDLALLATAPEYYEGETLEEHAAAYYDDCGFGYGDGRDGLMMVYDAQTKDILIVPFGAARDTVPEKYLRFVEGAAAEFREEYGVWGVMYATYKHLVNYMEDPAQYGGSTSTDAARAEQSRSAESAGGGMPDWYPADPGNFVFFHDENAPRVVDDADIFSDAEEKAMEARITELRRELQRDIVVFTDVSDHGLGHDIYSADFFDFNGYGYGDEREGFCLFICMDPNNRGFWTAGTGSDSMALQTEDAANALDDALIDYMVAGRYGEGAADWIENIAGLYRKGIPFAPDWYPDRGERVERFHDAAAPRVADLADVLSDAQEAALSERAAALSQKYGLDVVILMAGDPGVMTSREYAEKFYECCGYGLGDGYDGILLGVFESDDYYPWCRIVGVGKGAEKLTEVNEKRLKDRCDDALENGKYYGAANSWLSQTEHMLKTGRAPRSLTSWLVTAGLGVLLGSIFGGAALGVARGKMKTVRMRRNADAYLARESLRVDALRDDFVGTTTSRRYDPVQRESSGGGSSGGHRSSYSSSYHSSSGSSHSGSGRRF